ncbi:MAG: S-adenosylmethionine decarboxylase [Marinilabiliaceae bacterium]|nr:S-adenosylmethionine decarboxylase [Marinilabiliaceae bacterium]
MTQITPKILPPKVFNLKGWVQLIDQEQLKVHFEAGLIGAGFNVLDYSSHQFPFNGFTAFWLLAESHLALHTFAESGWCYVELTSCNAEKAIAFRALISDLSFAVNWEQEALEVSSAEVY